MSEEWTADDWYAYICRVTGFISDEHLAVARRAARSIASGTHPTQRREADTGGKAS